LKDKEYNKTCRIGARAPQRIEFWARIVIDKGENTTKGRVGNHHSQIEMGRIIIQKVGIGSSWKDLDIRKVRVISSRS
jgi:hypothetical protein